MCMQRLDEQLDEHGNIKIVERSEDGSRARAQIGGTEFEVGRLPAYLGTVSRSMAPQTAAAHLHCLISCPRSSSMPLACQLGSWGAQRLPQRAQVLTRPALAVQVSIEETEVNRAGTVGISLHVGSPNQVTAEDVGGV